MEFVTMSVGVRMKISFSQNDIGLHSNKNKEKSKKNVLTNKFSPL